MDLLCGLSQLKGQKVLQHHDGTACAIYPPVPFEITLYLCTASIRAYSATDVTVQSRLINLISNISVRDEQGRNKELYQKELDSIVQASAKEMKSDAEIEVVKAIVEEARKKRMQ